MCEPGSKEEGCGVWLRDEEYQCTDRKVTDWWLADNLIQLQACTRSIGSDRYQADRAPGPRRPQPPLEGAAGCRPSSRPR